MFEDDTEFEPEKDAEKPVPEEPEPCGKKNVIAFGGEAQIDPPNQMPTEFYQLFNDTIQQLMEIGGGKVPCEVFANLPIKPENEQIYELLVKFLGTYSFREHLFCRKN